MSVSEDFRSVLQETAACFARRDAQCADRLLSQVAVQSLRDDETAMLMGQRAEVADLQGNHEAASKLFREAVDRPGIAKDVKAALAQRYAGALLARGEFATTLRVLAAAFDCDTWTPEALIFRAAAYQRIYASTLAMENIDAAIRLYQGRGLAVPAAAGAMRQQLAESLEKAPRSSDLYSKPDLVPVLRSPPVYPKRAMSLGLTGCVLLEFSVSENGTVESARAIKSTNKVFEQPAVEALQKWRYAALLEQGLPVRREDVQTRISFALENTRSLPEGCLGPV
jgi:TonB family protein